ncbi:unnamed protein product [Rotaria sp. Silwood2]|nr:unnamed protein product [Rotaria sp. Silwood2]CAF4628723.1 unnamed protein product [Rotaria sp. Silwood2]
MSLSPYSPFYSYLISFNHEVQSYITLSYAYKCFICIILCRRFRFHAKNILCFLIENKYEDRFQNRTNGLIKPNNQKRHYITNLRSIKVPVSSQRVFLFKCLKCMSSSNNMFINVCIS